MIKKPSSKNNLKQPKCAIYVRVSTEEQAKEGFSLLGQEEALKDYAKSMGYLVYRIYKDEGKSAKDITHRPALQQLLKDADNHLFNAIFVYKLDRFSRSLKDLILTIEKLKDINVDFISLQDRIETASASGKLMFHIISSFAEFERDIISERTRFGMSEKAREGGVVSKAPFGYKIVDGQLVADPDKARQINELYTRFLNEKVSLGKLARSCGLTTAGMIKVLTNRTYIGEIKFKENYAGGHEAMISKELFDAVQQKLEKNSMHRAMLKSEGFLKTIGVSDINLASLLARKAIIYEISELDASNMQDKKALSKKLLLEQGFSEEEISFDRVFINADRIDCCGISEEKKIYVSYSAAKLSQLIEYLSEDIEFWIMEEKRCIMFSKGPSWEEVVSESLTSR